MTDPRALMAGAIERLSNANTIDEAGQILASWGHAIGNVLDLHKPSPNSTSALYPNPPCSGCGNDYPCPTVTAITTALEAS